jgi:hypothetical protein
MAQKHILLPQDTTLRLRIAFLEHEVAGLQVRLAQQAAEMQHQQTVTAVLQAAQIALPVPLSACTFDAEQGVLLYDAPAVPDDVPVRACPHEFSANHLT